MKKLFFSKLLFCMILFSINLNIETQAQGVCIGSNNTTPDPSAMLDVTATDKGALMPRLTEAQRNAIISPAQGLIIFNTTSNCFNFFKNGGWYEWCGTCIPPSAPVAASNSPVCAGASLNLTASTVPGATYSWTGPNGFTSTQQNPVITNATVAASGVYSVISILNCNSTASTTVCTVNSLPVSTFTALPVSPITGQSCTFTPTMTGATYNWSFQGGSPSTSTAQNPSVTWASTGTYAVSLTVTQNGCSSTTSSNISVSYCYNHSQSQTFSYTGSMQTWDVPAGVCTITVDIYGAQGYTGSNQGGPGGYAHGEIAVTTGTTINIFVGQQGQPGCNSTLSTNAFGGGGKGYSWNSTCSGGGGGASDIRIGGTALTDRVIVAGGGGGSTNNGGCTGGAGGGLTGGNSTCYGTVTGGTQTSGGVGGTNGTFGYGGDARTVYWIGGGGGGYYGGAAGNDHGSGSGGSSYYGGAGSYIPTNTSTTAGVRNGNGQVTIYW